MDDFWNYVVADIETDTLNAKIIHMVGVTNLITREYRAFIGPDEVAEACFYMGEQSKMIVGHHFEGFDVKVIERLTGMTYDRKSIVDTVKLSRKLCDLENHKLETWGHMLGLPKMKAPLFEVFTPEMPPYCKRDVELNVMVFDFLLELAITQKVLFTLPNADLICEYLVQKLSKANVVNSAIQSSVQAA